MSWPTRPAPRRTPSSSTAWADGRRPARRHDEPQRARVAVRERPGCPGRCPRRPATARPWPRRSAAATATTSEPDTRRRCGRSSDAEQPRGRGGGGARRSSSGCSSACLGGDATPLGAGAHVGRRSAVGAHEAPVPRRRGGQHGRGSAGTRPAARGASRRRPACRPAAGPPGRRARPSTAGAPPASPVASREHAAQRLLDQRLGVHVERRQRVVEHQHARPADHGPGQREPLPLPARQRQALLADPRVQPPRQVVDERRPGPPRAPRAISSSVASGPPEREVLAHAHREQRRLLERGGHVARGATRASGRGRRGRRA